MRLRRPPRGGVRRDEPGVPAPLRQLRRGRGRASSPTAASPRRGGHRRRHGHHRLGLCAREGAFLRCLGEQGDAPGCFATRRARSRPSSGDPPASGPRRVRDRRVRESERAGALARRRAARRAGGAGRRTLWSLCNARADWCHGQGDRRDSRPCPNRSPRAARVASAAAAGAAAADGGGGGGAGRCVRRGRRRRRRCARVGAAGALWRRRRRRRRTASRRRGRRGGRARNQPLQAALLSCAPPPLPLAGTARARTVRQAPPPAARTRAGARRPCRAAAPSASPTTEIST